MNDATTVPTGENTKFPVGPPLTLPQAVRSFFRHPTPYIFVGAVGGSWIAKIAVGGWSLGDLIVALIIVALWPIQEWLLHVYILHFKPRVFLGRRIDLLAGRMHRAHHREPGRPELIFIPTAIVLASLVVLPAAWLLPGPLARGLTGLGTYYVFALRYEWTHFLIHTTHRPQSRRFKRWWLNHRLHHYRNEHYWYGVSMLLGDKILGTAPDPKATPISPTCMTLGIEAELADATTPK